MGMIDDLEQKGIQALEGAMAQHGPMAQQLLQALQNGEHGGLSGIVQAFEQKGLGGLVSSWTGSGANQPVTGAQVQTALGQDKISAIASKLGIPADQAHEKLAQWLPTIIDKLTGGSKGAASV